MLHLPELVWTLHSSVLVVFNNLLLIDATDRSNISSNQRRFFFAASLYPLSFFANTPFKPFEFPVSIKVHACKDKLWIPFNINVLFPLNVTRIRYRERGIARFGHKFYQVGKIIINLIKYNLKSHNHIERIPQIFTFR